MNDFFSDMQRRAEMFSGGIYFAGADIKAGQAVVLNHEKEVVLAGQAGVKWMLRAYAHQSGRRVMMWYGAAGSLDACKRFVSEILFGSMHVELGIAPVDNLDSEYFVSSLSEFDEWEAQQEARAGK